MAKVADRTTGPYDPHGQPVWPSPNKIYLGPFAWNLNSGCGGTKTTYENVDRRSNYWRWPQGVHIIEEADRMGCEFHVPFARWQGHGGETHFNESQLEFLTVAAGLASRTKRMMLPSTSHVTYFFHPHHFAKWGATIDNMSGGRWGLNVVGGWIRDEVTLFGVEYPDHDMRYDMCDEFVTYMKLSWEMEEPFDFNGRFFRGKNVYVSPKPVAQPRPVFVQAGYSPAGMNFAAKHCDWLFFINVTGDINDLGAGYKRAQEYMDKYNRKLRIINYTWCVWAETDQKAEEIYKAQIDNVDEIPAAWFTYRGLDQPGTKGGSSFAAPLSTGSTLREAVGEGNYIRNGLLAGRAIVGGYDSVAEHMRIMKTEYGQDGFLNCWLDPLEGTHMTENHIIPRLVKMGMREY